MLVTVSTNIEDQESDCSMAWKTERQIEWQKWEPGEIERDVSQKPPTCMTNVPLKVQEFLRRAIIYL